MFVHEFFKEWLENKEVELETSTKEAYHTYINRHICPYFKEKNILLTELKPIHIKQYYTFKSITGRKDNKSGGLSKVSIKKHGNIIRQALNDAVILEYIDKNPAQNVKPPKTTVDTDKYTFLTKEQAQRIIKAFENHYLYEIVLITLIYGLRRSEVLGLKWSAIDFENEEIKINHTVVKNKTIVKKDRTKTHSSRRVYELLPEVKKVLQKLKEKQNKENAKIQDSENDDYIFKTEEGKLRRPDSLTKGFQRHLKKSGFTHMRFHDLRHSTASILFDQGWNVKDIQSWLGHKDIETTLNIYTHITDCRKKNLAKNLCGMFEIGNAL